MYKGQKAIGKYRKKGRGGKNQKQTQVKCGDGKKKKVAYTGEKVEENYPGPGGKISKYPK